MKTFDEIIDALNELATKDVAIKAKIDSIKRHVPQNIKKEKCIYK